MSSTRMVRGSQGGPPLPLLVIVSTALVVVGLVVSVVLAEGATFPSPFTDSSIISDYFGEHSTAVKWLGVFQFGASVPLALFAATVSTRLRNLGVRAPGATIALTGGVIAATLLALSALFTWTLSRNPDGPMVSALHELVFLTGGVGHVVFLGLLVAGVAVPALILRMAPRWVGISGILIALAAELSTLILVDRAFVALLPLGRFGGLAWLIGISFVIPTSRRDLAADRGDAR